MEEKKKLTDKTGSHEIALSIVLISSDISMRGHSGGVWMVAVCGRRQANRAVYFPLYVYVYEGM
jgi:hypothetical protein